MKQAKNIKNRKLKGFTLLEMLIVLCVIAVLILLFLPNMSKQKETIDAQGDAALTKVVQTQAELYRIENGKEPTLDILKEKKYLTKEQHKKAVEKNIDVKEKSDENP